MHSYILTTRGGTLEKAVYSVGLWLATGDSRGCTFSPLFDCPDFKAATVAVNMLNGGQPHLLEVIKEH